MCDMQCVSCHHYFCALHIRNCSSCSECTCADCQYNDLCCLVKSGTTEEQLKAFYENKNLTLGEFLIIAEQWDSPYEVVLNEVARRCQTIRLRVVQKSCNLRFFLNSTGEILERVTGWAGWLDCGMSILGQGIIVGDLDEEEKMALLEFLKTAAKKNPVESLPWFLCASKDREVILEALREFIESEEDVYKGILSLALNQEEGEELFNSMLKLKMIRFGKEILSIVRFLAHVSGARWLDSNGVDLISIIRGRSTHNPEILEYLFTVKKISFDVFLSYQKQYDKFPSSVIKALLRMKGVDCVQSIPIVKMFF